MKLRLHRTNAIIAGALLAVTLSAWATAGMTQPPGPEFGPGSQGPHRLEMFLAAMDLPTEQEAAIRDLAERESAGIRELHHELLEKRMSIANLDPGSVTYSRDVASLAGEIAGLTAELVIARGSVRAQVYQLLTPEQQARASRLKDRMIDRLRERRDRRAAAFTADSGGED